MVKVVARLKYPVPSPNLDLGIKSEATVLELVPAAPSLNRG